MPKPQNHITSIIHLVLRASFIFGAIVLAGRVSFPSCSLPAWARNRRWKHDVRSETACRAATGPDEGHPLCERTFCGLLRAGRLLAIIHTGRYGKRKRLQSAYLVTECARATRLESEAQRACRPRSSRKSTTLSERCEGVLCAAGLRAIHIIAEEQPRRELNANKVMKGSDCSPPVESCSEGV